MATAGCTLGCHSCGVWALHQLLGCRRSSILPRQAWEGTY